MDNSKDKIESTGSFSMPDGTDLEAKITLDWDDGQWYISNIRRPDDDTDSSMSSQDTSESETSGVKLAEWDENYRYQKKDIVAYEGFIYVSQQNTNQDNEPSSGTFWWKPIVDFTDINATAIQGLGVEQLAREVLSGRAITDFYTKAEVDNIILSYFNNVNARRLEDWSLDQIKTDYNNKIQESLETAKSYTETYFNDDGDDSIQQELIDLFDQNIEPDDVNRLD